MAAARVIHPNVTKMRLARDALAANSRRNETMPDASNAMSSLEMSELEAQVVQDAKPGTARVTLDDIKAQVMAEEYFRSFATLTICVLKLKNGFTVTGESACADVALFDAELGKKFAREDAMRKIWPLEAYFLRAKLHEAGL